MSFQYRVVFSKTGPLRYISHLDLVRMFMRACRRADLKLYLTKGFSPHPKIIFKRALKVGVESGHEEVSILLDEPVDARIVLERLGSKFPTGITIKEVLEVKPDRMIKPHEDRDPC